MTQTLTFHPKFGLRIPAKTLREAGFQPKKTFVIKINTPIINIIPQKYEEEDEKDWLDELLKDPIAQKNFELIVKEAEEDIKAGRVYSADEVFAEIKRERSRKI